jgi:RNA polymerase sigma-70 factor (ECF subfamily)
MISKLMRRKAGAASASRRVDKGASAPVQLPSPAAVQAQTMPAPTTDPARLMLEESNELLAARIAARDVQAFGLVYDRFAQQVYAMAGHMLGVTEAEEAAQEVFMRLWHKAAQYDPARGPFSHWFLSIARNLMLDKLRARGERARVVAIEEIDLLLSEMPDPQVDVVEQVWQNQRGDALAHALARIPPEQRRVIVLAYFGGMSQSEIAMQLQVPLGTVKKRIRLGLQKLRAALSPRALLDLHHEPAATPADVES